MNILLKGEKVVLRDIRPEDLDTLYYWYYEANDREHLNWNSPYKPLEPMTLEEYRQLPKHREALALAGTDKPRTELIIEIDGELKGSVGRYWVSEVTNWFEIGIVIYDSRYWSNGYGSEAFQMWIDYLFTHMDTVRLGIGTWSGNERMIRLAARCGMIEEARVRKARIVRGEYYDAIKMGILREEWEARRQLGQGG
ncbi:RimJ/RimL family protein N-acetyltransferase [Brevibacillus aydinogluensis]|jgi:RimJ/RimL family protein N-acetyltransferase|uniref:GNAT family acetyltransferase n=1 Tax=Brevibacillus aydinogluensis TaxID=927786 RepID=A0AA48M7X6_9BACL|nr:GNAT family protein [Brevibacillus aydinogluensis]MDT3415984.1 RimJ/RimL family protein N-acetyltransferase [Brevibacillus aydinogluensis]CAJ1001591.1 GNAT family acetyltransferase [Brevibacillus aydinogluensis]